MLQIANSAPWHALNYYQVAAIKLKQKTELPDYVKYLTSGTALYEATIREAWEAFKLNPSESTAKSFAEALQLASGELWPELLAQVLGIDEEDLTERQREFLKEYLEEHHNYIKNSLLPDVVKAIRDKKLDSLDYRTTFLYAGALWAFGNLATVMFDGTELRDLADLFLFAGPNDESTCTGERGCAQHANNVYTVAEILGDEIIPGRLRCVTNCRHILLPVASPLKGKKKEWNGKGVSVGELWVRKHLPGRHDQRRHTPYRYRGARAGTLLTRDALESKYVHVFEDLDDSERNIVFDGLLRYGVTEEDMKGLNAVTTEALSEHGYHYDEYGRLIGPEGNRVAGAYDPRSGVMSISSFEMDNAIKQEAEYGETEATRRVHKTLLHEVGHNVTMRSGPGVGSRLYSRTVAMDLKKEFVEDDYGSLSDIGLRPYSLAHDLEFLADSYMVMRAGSYDQRDALEQVWVAAGDFDRLEAVFKEFPVVKVQELRGVVRRNDVVEFVWVDAEVPTSVIATTPWYYEGKSIILKHLPGRHPQQRHAGTRGAHTVDGYTEATIDKPNVKLFEKMQSDVKLNFNYSGAIIDDLLNSQARDLIVAMGDDDETRERALDVIQDQQTGDLRWQQVIGEFGGTKLPKVPDGYRRVGLFHTHPPGHPLEISGFDQLKVNPMLREGGVFSIGGYDKGTPIAKTWFIYPGDTSVGEPYTGKLKHMPGRHPQQRHAGARGRVVSVAEQAGLKPDKARQERFLEIIKDESLNFFQKQEAIRSEIGELPGGEQALLESEKWFYNPGDPDKAEYDEDAYLGYQALMKATWDTGVPEDYTFEEYVEDQAEELGYLPGGETALNDAMQAVIDGEATSEQVEAMSALYDYNQAYMKSTAFPTSKYQLYRGLSLDEHDRAGLVVGNEVKVSSLSHWSENETTPAKFAADNLPADDLSYGEVILHKSFKPEDIFSHYRAAADKPDVMNNLEYEQEIVPISLGTSKVVHTSTKTSDWTGEEVLHVWLE